MSRRLAALLVTLALLGSGCAYFNTFHHAKKYYGQAQSQDKKARERGEDSAAQSAGLYKQSIDKCKKLLDTYPDSKWRDDAMLLMAKAYYGRGDYEIAEQTLIDFGNEFPQSNLYPESRYWLGLTAFALEDYAEARRIWSELLEDDPDFDDAEEVAYQLERTYGEEGDIELAVQSSRTYLKTYPNEDNAVDVRIDLARYLLDLDQPAEAQKVATEVTRTARNDLDLVEGQLLLGEAYGEQNQYEQALEVYIDAAILLDPEVYKGRMTDEQRSAIQRAEREQAVQDSLDRAAGKAVSRRSNQDRYQRTQRDLRDPKQRLLALVMLSEGQALGRLNRPKDAIIAYEQVLREFPRSSYSAEAEYRIGYTYEVLLEDFDRAQRAYADVPNQGASIYRDEALRRARNLDAVQSLLATSANDTLSEATAAAAEAQFMRAELYLFQQEKPERALEEYGAIETEFAGTDYAAKAGLASAWLLHHSLGDSLAALEKYEEIAASYPNSEYGRRATRWLAGPEADPQPVDFAGPTLEELRHPLNLAVVAPEDTALTGGTGASLAAATPPPTPPPPPTSSSPPPGRDPVPAGEAASLGAALASTPTAGAGGVNPGASPMLDPGSVPGPPPAAAGAAGIGAAGAATAALEAPAPGGGLNPAAVPPPAGAVTASSSPGSSGPDPSLVVPLEPPADRVQGHLLEVPRDLYLDPLAIPPAEGVSADAAPALGGDSPSSAPAATPPPPRRSLPTPNAIPSPDAPPLPPAPSAVPPPSPPPASSTSKPEATGTQKPETTRTETPRSNVSRRSTPPRNVTPERKPSKEEAPKKGEEAPKKTEESDKKKEDGKSSEDKGAPPDSSSGDRS